MASVAIEGMAHERLAAQKLRIVYAAAGHEVRSFTLQSSEMQVGSGPEAFIFLDDPSVRPLHARIYPHEDRYLIEATDGAELEVDGTPVLRAALRPGQEFRVGQVALSLRAEDEPLEIAPDAEVRLGDLVGSSVAMRRIFALIKRVAGSDSTVLLVGETGTGKGAAARALHTLSPRSSGPLIVFDCASIAPSLIESELFGHEKGAFTGAQERRIGCLERANGGTLFLDEIDDLALELQPKLLRALEDRQFRRVGGADPIPFDARIIAASKKDLWTEAAQARFREDLYFRLSVFTLTLPPLRERREDIPLLVNAFGDDALWTQLASQVRDRFLAHPWHGNVRELRNAIERARHFSDIPELGGDALLRDLPLGLPQEENVPVRYNGPFKECKEDLIRRFEKEYLTRLLAHAGGNVAKAAREAGVDRKHLYSLLHKYSLVKD
jgi:DNA-binding NtrC family response regulator